MYLLYRHQGPGSTIIKPANLLRYRQDPSFVHLRWPIAQAAARPIPPACRSLPRYSSPTLVEVLPQYLCANRRGRARQSVFCLRQRMRSAGFPAQGGKQTRSRIVVIAPAAIFVAGNLSKSKPTDRTEVGGIEQIACAGNVSFLPYFGDLD